MANKSKTTRRWAVIRLKGKSIEVDSTWRYEGDATAEAMHINVTRGGTHIVEPATDVR